MIYFAAWVFLCHADFMKSLSTSRFHRAESWRGSLIFIFDLGQHFISQGRLEIWLTVCAAKRVVYIVRVFFNPTEIHFQHHKHTNLFHQNQLSSINRMHFISVVRVVLSASMGLS